MLIWLMLFGLDNDGPGSGVLPPAPAVGGYRLRRFSRSNT